MHLYCNACCCNFRATKTLNDLYHQQSLKVTTLEDNIRKLVQHVDQQCDELKECEMKNNDQLDQIKELKREILEKEEMLCTAGNRLSELNHILNKQHKESHEKDKVIQSL